MDVLTALGLALAYRDWRHGHEARGAVVLVLAAGIAKPHLALGLAAFLIGWRQRRAIVGALVGLGALAVASVAVVGTAGVDGVCRPRDRAGRGVGSAAAC